MTAFKDRPPTPPSRAQEILCKGLNQSSNPDDTKAALGEATTEGLDENNVNYGASIKRLMTNRGYVLLLITYGLNVGVFYAIATLLNTVVLTHFKVHIMLSRRCLFPKNLENFQKTFENF
jgi:FLVCR family feline leukemia virus subgroup C receptor-related protein